MQAWGKWRHMPIALEGLAEFRFKIMYRMQYIPLLTAFIVRVGLVVVSMLFIRSVVITSSFSQLQAV